MSAGHGLRIAYMVSRFPAASETFVVRELDAVAAADPELELSLLSLFPSNDRFVHERARPWLQRLHRPSPPEGARALGHWALRSPLRLAGAVASIVRAGWRDPRLLARSLATVPIAAAQARRIRDARVDHVHAHFASYPTLAAWLCGRLTGISYSFTAHAYDIFITQTMLESKVREAQFVATISEFNRRFLRAYGGDSETPVAVVHCGVDPTEYAFEPRSVPPDGEVRGLCVAGLQEKKGHAVLLEALASAPGLERLRVDLVGGGPLRGELEAWARELGLANRVRFHGPLEETAVREMLAGADLFVLPSVIASDGQMEGLPVALIEALACGVPAVSTRLSGIPELIDDRRTGLLAEAGNPDSLAEALEWLLGGGELDLEAARRLVESEFDVRRSGEQMVDLFEARVG